MSDQTTEVSKSLLYCRWYNAHKLRIIRDFTEGRLAVFDDDDPDEKGQTILHWASTFDDQAIFLSVHTFLPSLVHRRDHYGRTPLHLASGSGCVNIVHLLIVNGASVLVTDVFGRTPLHYAAAFGHLNVAARLMTSSLRNSNQSSGCVVTSKDCEPIKYSRQLVSAVDCRGKSALHLAIGGCHWEIAEFLSQSTCTAAEKEQSGVFDERDQPFIRLVRATISHKATEFACRRREIDVKSADSLGNTVLHLITPSESTDSATVIKLLLECGASVNARNPLNRTPLHHACIRLQFDVADALIRFQADVNARDIFGATPLFYACLFHYLQVDELDQVTSLAARYGQNLLAELKHYQSLGACIRLWNIREDRSLLKPEVLQAATDRRRLGEIQSKLVNLLVEAKADVNAQDHVGRAPLHVGASVGNLDVVRCLVRHGADLLATDDHVTTALHDAVRFRQNDVIAFILQSAKDQNIVETVLRVKDIRPGSTALHLAAESNMQAIVSSLIAFGADVNTADYSGCSPLHRAAEQRANEAVEVLLQNGADVNAVDYLGCTPLLMMASCSKRCSEQDYQTMRSLIRHGASVNIQNCIGRTPLHCAVTESADLVHFLLSVDGVDVNLADDYGNTPLHMSCDEPLNRPSTAAVLLREANVDVNKQNHYGMTALHHACINRNSVKCNHALVRLLLEKGASRNIADDVGALPIHYAVHLENLGAAVTGNSAEPKRHLEKADLLLSENTSCGQKTRASHQTPLHVLCRSTLGTFRYHDLTIGDNRLKLTTDISDVDSMGNTAVHYAPNALMTCRENQLCINIGHLQNSCGLTPAMMQVCRGDRLDRTLECLQGDRDWMQRTVLHLKWGSLKTYDVRTAGFWLETFGHLLEQTDVFSRTCFHHLCINAKIYSSLGAFERVNLDHIRFLVNKMRPIINAQDCFGRTALFYALIYQEKQFCKIMLESGADPNLQDNDGVAPSDIQRILQARSDNADRTSVDNDTCKCKVVTAYNVPKKNHSISNATSSLSSTSVIIDLYESVLARQNQNQTSYHEALKTGISQFVTRVMRLIEEQDSRFSSSVLMVGSSAQNVRSQLPEEYDFLIVLERLSEVCVATDNTDIPGHAKFSLAAEYFRDHRYTELCDSHLILQPKIVFQKLFSLLAAALSRPEAWHCGLFEYLSVSMRRKPNCPAIAMTIGLNRLLLGQTSFVFPNDTRISVDFVPALRTGRIIQPNSELSEYCKHHPELNNVDFGEFAVMKQPKGSFGRLANGLCAASFVHVQSELIRCSPAPVKAVYMWLKHICGDLNLHKYLLVIPLLRCIISKQFGDEDTVTNYSINKCIRIYLREIWNAIVNDAIPSLTDTNLLLPVWEMEPFAKFSIIYLRRFGMRYTTNVGDPDLSDPESRLKMLSNLGMGTRSRNFELQSPWTTKTVLQIRKQFNCASEFIEKLLGEEQRDEILESLEDAWKPEVTEEEKKLIRLTAMFDDIVLEKYVNEADQVDSTPFEFVMSGDTR